MANVQEQRLPEYHAALIHFAIQIGVLDRLFEHVPDRHEVTDLAGFKAALGQLPMGGLRGGKRGSCRVVDRPGSLTLHLRYTTLGLIYTERWVYLKRAGKAIISREYGWESQVDRLAA